MINRVRIANVSKATEIVNKMFLPFTSAHENFCSWRKNRPNNSEQLASVLDVMSQEEVDEFEECFKERIANQCMSSNTNARLTLFTGLFTLVSPICIYSLSSNPYGVVTYLLAMLISGEKTATSANRWKTEDTIEALVKIKKFLSDNALDEEHTTFELYRSFISGRIPTLHVFLAQWLQERPSASEVLALSTALSISNSPS